MCFLPKVAALFASAELPLQYYYFLEKPSALNVITLIQEKLHTLRVTILFQEKLPTLRVIPLF